MRRISQRVGHSPALFSVQLIAPILHALARFFAFRSRAATSSYGPCECRKFNSSAVLVVLPEWIEHSTSPLPRGCSTTELRQQKHAHHHGRRERGGNCHIGPHRRKAKTWCRAWTQACACEGAWLADNDAMARMDDGQKPNKPKQPGSRSARLAAALRENLRRRKAQERQRGAPPLSDPRTKATHDDKNS